MNEHLHRVTLTLAVTVNVAHIPSLREDWRELIEAVEHMDIRAIRHEWSDSGLNWPPILEQLRDAAEEE